MTELVPQRKTIGFKTCTALVIGNMVGSGIFLLPSALAQYGAISLFGWILTGCGAMLVALVFARLSRLLPRAGGPYAYTRAAFGDFAGFLIAWGYWIAIMCGNAAIAVAMISYLSVFVPALAGDGFLAAGCAIATLWILSFVNARGVWAAGKVQIVTTVLKLMPLLALGTVGFLWFEPNHFQPLNLSGQSNFSALTATAALTLWAFMGLESATVPADDVDQPGRTIARATVIGTAIAAVFYVLTTAAVMGIIEPSELSESNAPFADAARRIWGPIGGYAVAAGAVISCFGALNGWILNQGQIPRAAARDGLFPAFFDKSARNGAPVAGLFVSSVLVTLLVATNYTRGLVDLFTFAILLSTLTALIPFAFCTMALLLFPMRGEAGARSLPRARTALVAVPAFIYSLWAIAGSGQDVVFWGFLLLMAGLPVYVTIEYQRARRDLADSRDAVAEPAE